MQQLNLSSSDSENTVSPRLLTVADAAKRLNISTSLVYQLVESGKIAVHRVGTGRGTIRFRVEDIDSYIDSCRVECTTPTLPKIRPKLKHIKLNTKSG